MYSNVRLPARGSRIACRNGRIVVAIEHRFVRCGGRVFSSTMTLDRMWSRYLAVFDEVHVLARVADVRSVPASYEFAGGPGVSWIPVPHYIGPWSFLLRGADVVRAVRHARDVGDAFMLRVPGTIGTLLWRELRKAGLPYGVEVVADPFDGFAPRAHRSRLHFLWRKLFTDALRAQCRDAAVAAYVTEQALQRRYPTSGWHTSYSSVELEDESFATEVDVKNRLGAYARARVSGTWTCLHIGSMSEIRKRQDAVIEAVSICRRRGLDLRLRLVGSGVLVDNLRRLAEKLGIQSYVEFLGQIPPGKPVRDVMDHSDLFILPTMAEGLPRVLIEAMARGVPCLATDVGGISELLGPNERFNVDKIDQLPEKIELLLKDQGRLTALVRGNIERARSYHAQMLQERRVECYEELMRRTDRSYDTDQRAG